ncbi:MAG: DUF389 domain-containing protein [Bacteroidaceae bacterium]|nr:DUF389 domain-containing protein [Bacteroidaceae bacterium]
MSTSHSITERVREYFNLMPDRDEEELIIEQISKGVSFRGANLWVLICAILIASLGLNVNSTAVIIGAMLISPLMGPIIGMGLAVGINDLDLLKRSAKNFGVATLISVITATVYFLLTPLGDAQSELLARTSPTVYDVFIAFCGGAAGIIALCTGGKGNVIPGVAIATALMPPLCTAGYGLATGHLLYFLGAFYLFFINTVFICLATYGGVRLMQFHRREFLSPAIAKKAQRIIWGVVVVTMLPAVAMTVGIVRRSVFDNNVRNFIKTELSQQGTQVISSEVDAETSTLRIVAVGREITEATQEAARRHMGLYGLDGYGLAVIQGSQSDSLLLSVQRSQAASTRESERQKLLEMSSEVSTLTQQLEASEQALSRYMDLEQLCTELRPELAALFPQVQSLTLAQVVTASMDTVSEASYVMSVVDLKTPLPAAEKARLHDWLQARVAADSLRLVLE